MREWVVDCYSNNMEEYGAMSRPITYIVTNIYLYIKANLYWQKIIQCMNTYKHDKEHNYQILSIYLQTQVPGEDQLYR